MMVEQLMLDHNGGEGLLFVHPIGLLLASSLGFAFIILRWKRCRRRHRCTCWFVLVSIVVVVPLYLNGPTAQEGLV
jgi:hypothetical protein